MKTLRKPSKSAQRQEALGVKTRILRLRVKDKHASFLGSQSVEVNQVWNYSQELSLKVLSREQRFMSAFDMAAYTQGSTKEGLLSLHSQTVQAVSEEYCARRKQYKRAKLRWRVSRGSRRSLGWIPFKAVAIAYRNGQLHYQGKAISLWDSYGLSGYKLRGGSFSEDARGRWYVNIQVDVVPTLKCSGTTSIGIDLGLKDLAACSDATKVEAQRFYRDLEGPLGVAQRANKKSRVKAIHAKIANRRKDFSHKLSRALVKQHAAIFVGDVNAKALSKTSMAKSVLDAGWSQFRKMLQYKCDDAGSIFQVVNEAYSTQECSHCHSLTGPKGQSGLNERNWVCSACGAAHDRDVNSARIIRARGWQELEKEFAIAVEGKTCESAMNKDSGAQGLSRDVSSMAAVGRDRPVEGIPVLTASQRQPQG